MVHRPTDSRLLANLIAQEKDHEKQLLAVSDSSHASLASLSAYAAASPTPIARVIFAVTDALASADNALQLYAASVHEWRLHLKALKTLEDEVGNIVRDREILVTRLLKASKTQKSLARDGLNLPSTSVSATSLRSDLSFTPTKLTAAQSELLACESQLATKERELWECRIRTVREGLGARCNAMVECGLAWSERGEEAFKLLEGMNIGSTGPDMLVPLHLGLDVDPGASMSAPSAKYQPIAMPRLSSDLISPSPSQSHEEDAASGHQYQHANADADTNSRANWHPNANLGDLEGGMSPSSSTRLHILPAHAISDFVFPTSHEVTPPASPKPTPIIATAMTTTMPSLPPRVLPHRITEEDLHRDYSAEEGSSVEEDAVGPLQLVENPQFSTQPFSSRTHDTHPKWFSIRNVVKSDTSASAASKRENRARKASTSSTPARSRFFGSLRLRSLFRRETEDLSDGSPDTSPRLPSTRTAGNTKKTKAGSSDESTIVIAPSPVSGPSTASSVNPGGGRRLRKRSTRRTRKDVGGSPLSVQDQTLQDREGVGNGGEVSRDGGVLVHDVDTGSSDKEKLSRSSPTSREHGTGTGVSSGGLPTGNTGNGTDGTKRSSSVDVIRDRAAYHGGAEPEETETSSGGRRGASLDGQSRSAVLSSDGPTTVGTRRGRRGGARTGVGRSDAGVDESGLSLMSIVEGVTRQNREGWSKYVDSQEGVGGFGGGPSYVGDREREKMGNGNALAMVKAPPPVSRDELDAMVMKSSMGAISVAGIKDVGTGHPASRSAPSLVSPSASEPAVHTDGEALLKPPRGATTKGPLKSALRNTSRTPSPSALVAPSLRTGGENARDRGRKKRRSVLLIEERGGSDDEASESSYETGHETFDEEEDGREGEPKDKGEDKDSKDRALPATPPPDKQVHDRPAVNGHTTSRRKEDLDRNHGDSDVSESTQSTEILVNGAGQGRDQGTVRRKSVRVSLHPTFSSTPPAIDDDMLSSPWSRAEADGVGGWESGVKYPRENVDMWEDSSEEDEGYQKARRLLMAKTH